MFEISETIILAPGAKQAELLKSLAKVNVNTFGFRIVSSCELANIALERNGIAIKQTFLSEIKQALLIYDNLKKTNYFKQYTFSDACALIKSFNEFRQYTPNDDDFTKLDSSSFKEKNDAIKSVFTNYLEKLSNTDSIDEISNIRLAIDNDCQITNVRFVTYEEFPLTPLEKKLLDVVSCGKFETLCLSDLSKILNVKTYTKAFGTTNEIENILGYINDNELPMDQCMVVTTENTLYSKILTNYRDVLGFNLTIGLSESISSTNAGRLFSSLDDWCENFNFIDYLNKIVYANYFNLEQFKLDIGFDEANIPINESLSYLKKISFDTIITYIGNLKLSFDKNINNEKVDLLVKNVNHELQLNSTKLDVLREQIILGYVNNAKEILNCGYAHFINKYTKINLANLSKENNALTSITSLLLLSEENNIPYSDIRTAILQTSVGGASSESGKLLVTSIQKAKSIFRPYVFIVGLSNNYFPGGPQEDPMFLDEDYAQFGEIDHSNNKITFKKNDLTYLITLLNTYSQEIHLSFSIYNSETLKSQSCSSAILDIYKKENGNDKTLSNFNDEFIKSSNKFKFVKFFSSKLLDDNKIGNALLENKIVEPILNANEPILDQKVENYHKISLSASRVETYVKCPYKFFLKYVLGLPDPVDNDMFEVMSAIDSGNLVHSLLENFQKTNTPGEKENLLENAKNALNKYFLEHPTTNEISKEIKSKQFLQMIENAYDMDDGYPNLLAEEDLSCVHKESGLLIHGFPDKVVIHNNELKIIDFKTKNKIEHDFLEPETVVQLVMYSYIIEHSTTLKDKNGKNFKVRELEYRYLKLKEKPNGCDIEQYYEEFSKQLIDLKNSYETGVFKQNTRNCAFCKFKDICRPKEKKDG